VSSPPPADKRVRGADKTTTPSTDPDCLSFEELRACTVAKIRLDPKVNEWLTAWSLLLANDDETLGSRVLDFTQRLFNEPTTITTRRMVLKIPDFTVGLLGQLGAPKRLHTRSLTEKEEWLRRQAQAQAAPLYPSPPPDKEIVAEVPRPLVEVDMQALPTLMTKVESMDMWTFLLVFGQWYGANLLERSLTEAYAPVVGLGLSMSDAQPLWIQANGTPLPAPQTMLNKLVQASSLSGPKAELLCSPFSFDTVDSLQDALFDLKLDPAALRVAANKALEKYSLLPGPHVYKVDTSTWLYFVCWTLFHGLPLFCTVERHALLATARATMPLQSSDMV
jgi:hypothetical protein